MDTFCYNPVRIGNSDCINLACNENPCGVSDRVLATMRECSVDRINRYPHIGRNDLQEKIAEIEGLAASQVCLGAGSSGVLSDLFTLLLQPGTELVLFKHSFGLYSFLAKLRLAETVCVEDSLGAPCLDALVSEVTDKTRCIILANPNNPTGSLYTVDHIQKLYTALPDHVFLIIDEAYHEYLGDDATYTSAASLVSTCPRLCVVRTFSKFYGLASLRIGYVLATSDLIDTIKQVQMPYVVGSLAYDFAMHVLDDNDHHRLTSRVCRDGRKRLFSAFRLKRWLCLPAPANFVTVKIPGGAESFCLFMRKKSVFVLSLASYGMSDYVRVSIGTDSDVSCFLSLLDQYDLTV